MKDLSIIIVSYNTSEFLRKCLASIYKYTKDIVFEIIIVDNASIDDSVDMLKSEFPDIVLIVNGQNEGFSKANNQGVKKATGSYLLFLNPDTVFEQETLKEMARFMDNHKEAGAATCKLVLPNGRLDDASHRGFPTPWNAFCHFFGLSKLFEKTKLFGGYSMSYLSLEKTHEIDALAGAFMLVRRKAGEQVGWWDEDFFWYGDDLDFCYRLKEKGWKIFFVPKVMVLHFKGVAGGIKKISKEITTASKQTKIRAQKSRFLAMKIFYQKHYKKKYPAFITWLVMWAITLKLKAALQTIRE